MKKVAFPLIACLFIWITSCEHERNDENSTGCFQVDLNDPAGYTIDTKWIFLGFLHPDTRKADCKPENIQEMSIEFQDSNKFHAISSCNMFGGYYSVSAPDSLEIDSIFTTLIYCISDTVREWEDRYLNELRNATNYQIIGNRLSIETLSDMIIVFKADP
jgi:heat shock protein HslJ